jgi:membrane protease YdiL (CAAX protease family)
MYLWPRERKSDYVRDDPKNIRRRMISLVGVSIGGLVFVWARRGNNLAGSLSSKMSSILRFGIDILAGAAATGKSPSATPSVGNALLNHSTLTSVGNAVAATLTLFTGVIVNRAVDLYNECVASRAVCAKKEPIALQMIKLEVESLGNEVHSWGALRTFVVAPFVEEFYFRGLLFRLLRDPTSTGNQRSAVLASAAAFAFAHLHHFRRYYYEFRDRTTRGYTHQQAVAAAARRSAFDVLITTAFGLFSGLQFILFGESVLATAISHSICNWLGAPSLEYLRDRSLSEVQRKAISVSYALGILVFGWRWLGRR